MITRRRLLEVAGTGAVLAGGNLAFPRLLDAKGPMDWDGGEASAGLTKDILALANCRDGGVIVVGKEEPGPGKFLLTGLTESGFDFQCESWSRFRLNCSWLHGDI